MLIRGYIIGLASGVGVDITLQKVDRSEGCYHAPS